MPTINMPRTKAPYINMRIIPFYGLGAVAYRKRKPLSLKLSPISYAPYCKQQKTKKTSPKAGLRYVLLDGGLLRVVICSDPLSRPLVLLH
jgi:hypothetical protein